MGSMNEVEDLIIVVLLIYYVKYALNNTKPASYNTQIH